MDIYQLYISVVDQGSFNKASEQLGITQPTVSKRIDMLEDKMGIKLFKRSTRKLMLTAAGELFYERAKTINQLMIETEQDVKHLSSNRENMLSISASLSVAAVFLPPVLAKLQERYPDARFRLHTEIAYGNYYRQNYELEYDLFLREGESADTNLVSTRLGSIPISIYVAPSYLEKNGTPKNFEELAATGHCIGSRLLKSNNWAENLLSNVDLSNFKFVLSGNDNLSLVPHAEAGMGFLFASENLVQRSLEEGRLVKMAFDVPINNLPLNGLYRKEYITPIARECLDLLKEEVGKHYPLS